MLLLRVALSFAVLHVQLAQDIDCVVCPAGFYPADCTDDCAMANSSGSGSGGSSSANDRNGGSTSDMLACAPCHSSCLECFGPRPTECNRCPGLFVLLPTPSNRTNVSDCNDVLAMLTPQPVLHCVEECPPGSSNVTGSQQCTCLQGKYQDESQCLNCSSNCLTCVNGTENGCLTCSSYSYENSCVQSCPAHTLPDDDRQCLPVQEELTVLLDLIILMIISIAIVLILLIFVITLFYCLGLYCYKKKVIKSRNFNSKHNPVTLANSFRRVTTDFGNQTRLIRQSFGAVERNEYEMPPSLSPELDPYTASNALELQDASMDEAVDQNTDHEEGEDMYIQMNPSCSSSLNSHTNNNIEPDPPVPIRTTSSNKTQSGLPPPQSERYSPQGYITPRDLATPSYYVNQPAIDCHLLNSEEQALYNSSPNVPENESEQELYEDMSGGLEASSPVVPPRSVLCAEQFEYTDADTDCVEMTPQLNTTHPSKHLEQHSYVNVLHSSQNGQMKDVTSTIQSTSQPTYYNVVRNGASAIKL